MFEVFYLKHPNILGDFCVAPAAHLSAQTKYLMCDGFIPDVLKA